MNDKPSLKALLGLNGIAVLLCVVLGFALKDQPRYLPMIFASVATIAFLSILEWIRQRGGK